MTDKFEDTYDYVLGLEHDYEKLLGDVYSSQGNIDKDELLSRMNEVLMHMMDLRERLVDGFCPDEKMREILFSQIDNKRLANQDNFKK